MSQEPVYMARVAYAGVVWKPLSWQEATILAAEKGMGVLKAGDWNTFWKGLRISVEPDHTNALKLVESLTWLKSADKLLAVGIMTRDIQLLQAADNAGHPKAPIEIYFHSIFGLGNRDVPKYGMDALRKGAEQNDIECIYFLERSDTF